MFVTHSYRPTYFNNGSGPKANTYTCTVENLKSMTDLLTDGLSDVNFATHHNTAKFQRNFALKKPSII